MLNARAFANAATVITAVYSAACLLLSYVAPDFLLGVAGAAIHLNLQGLKAAQSPAASSTIVGFITVVAFAWVTSYLTIWLYNRWAER